MVFFSNCKINLGLHITSKRNDGFHNLETCFYPINFFDVIEIIPSKNFEFTTTGLPINIDIENNLCVKAYQLLKDNFPELPNVKIHLHKNIPMGAGIGGGSANAAYVLKGLQQKFNLPFSNTDLEIFAAQLGSDCTFFIQNQPCIASGRGEVLKTLKLDLSIYQILLIFPNVYISTKEAFAHIQPKLLTQNIETLLQKPITNWKNNLQNDFEFSVFKQYPQLATIKEKLYNAGVLYASMSGSGSTIYGIFPNNLNLENIVTHNFSTFKNIIIPVTK